MDFTFQQYEESAQAIRARLGGFAPKVAMILGSGLGFLGDEVENPIAVDYKDIPYFKPSTAPGHKGRLVFGTLEGQQVAVMLYGFASKSEKHCFELLLGISGVGPKAALSILSSNTPDGLALAVLNGDEKALTSAPGIGKRIAQRILLELKDKMAKESASVDFADMAPAVPASDAASAARSDAIAGLTVLGYSMPEINAALRTLPSIEGMSADQIIKAALRAMMQQ